MVLKVILSHLISWSFTSLIGCNCSSVGAVSNVCNNMTGSCYCQPYVTGRSCDRCEENAFNYTEYGCMPCNCNSDGSDDLQCDSVSHLYALCRNDCRTYINIRNVPTIDQITLRPPCIGEVWKRRFHPDTASNVFRCFSSTLCRRNLKTQGTQENSSIKSQNNFRVLILFQKVHFGNIRPHLNLNPTFSNSLGLKSVFKTPLSWQISLDCRPNRKKKAVFSDSSSLVWTGPNENDIDLQELCRVSEVFLSFRPPWPFSFLASASNLCFLEKISPQLRLGP